MKSNEDYFPTDDTLDVMLQEEWLEAMGILKKEYHDIPVPKQAQDAIQRGIQRAREESVLESETQGVSAKLEKSKRGGRFYGGMAAFTTLAATLLLFVLCGSSAQVAAAVADIPMLKPIVELMTGEEYHDDVYLDVKVAHLSAQGNAMLQSSAEKINGEVAQYTNAMMEQFYAEQERYGGVQGLDITYEVVADTDGWFTLCVTATETKASGAETRHYYNLDKTTGQYVQLSDLFLEDADYIGVISDAIKMQMQQRMTEDGDTVYYVDESIAENNFQQIAPEQNYYINADGCLVIVFDEYTVAPGSMGCTEFVIPSDVIASILK